MYCSIDESVFTRFPGYVRGVVVAHGVVNGESPSDLIDLLRQTEGALRKQLHIDTLTADPRIASWREAYRAIGAKPSEFRPSMEAMARRILHGMEVPSINRLVDLGNIFSLHALVPVGGHAIDFLSQDITLRPAGGSETFIPFGSQEIEHPLPGEIVFVEDQIVLCRRWTWRQSTHTLVLPTTTAIEINVDGLPPVPMAEVEKICAEMIPLLIHYCGGSARYEVLSQGHPRMSLLP